MELPKGRISWKEEYNLGVELIDTNHRKFLEILNNLLEILEARDCKERISEVFFSLVYYAEHNLIGEQIHYKEYPGFNMHREMHDQFIERITKFRDDFNLEKGDICKELAFYLYGWFQNHILEYDTDAVAYLKEKGVE